MRCNRVLDLSGADVVSLDLIALRHQFTSLCKEKRGQQCRGVLTDLLADGTGTNRQGSRTRPRRGATRKSSRSSQGSEACAKLRVSRSMIGVWNRSDSAKASLIMGRAWAGPVGSRRGISRIPASGRVS